MTALNVLGDPLLACSDAPLSGFFRDGCCHTDENDHGTHVVCATSTSGSDPRHMTPLHPKKLLLTKWTAVQPIAKNKHFFVSRVIEPEPPELAIEWVELEAVYSKAVTRIHWRQLQDETLWRRGWQSAGRQQP